MIVLCYNTAFTQTISSYIYDIKTKKPLSGATVYLDGTTIGTISDFEGYFELNIEDPSSAKVVISYIGYDTRVFKIFELDPKLPIHLTQSTNKINEVELQFDLWSRSKKMHIFKREFLGNDYAASRCKIKNEKDIVLIHNSTENTLTAYSDKPIAIINKYLGYEIYYNLIDFEIEFTDHISGSTISQSVFYIGTSFYSDLNERIKKSILKNRKQTYTGSLLHFMRSLSTSKLTENEFSFSYNHEQMDPYKIFEIRKQDNLSAIVRFNTENIAVVYKDKQHSHIKLKHEDQKTFYIDKTGNYSPTSSLIFSGALGQKRMSSTLPFNYELN